ncbi:MAG: ribosome maturation factor RimP [Myxococcales bacterium]|nr:ribosome maturation factor RimP [Myxococcales bacterium]
MPKRDATITRLEAIAEPICRAHGVELVCVELHRGKGAAIVRVYIDRARTDGLDGSDIGLGDCTAVSRDLSDALDVHGDILRSRYALEVSSPGLERPLPRLSDFERFRGREAVLRLEQSLDGRRKVQGVILGVEGDSVRIDRGGDPILIAHENIAKAHLVHRFS